MAVRTGTMERVGAGTEGEPTPGLVLLCAKDISRVPQVFPLRRGEVVLGREPPPGGCRIDQTAVSREHARIVRAGAACTLEDMGSRNGTYVDGARVDRTTLRDRAEIRVGDTLFALVADGIDDYSPYALDGSLPLATERLSSAVPELVGGLQMDRIAAHIETAARTDLPLLVLGETGTGKEVAARALHRLSGRTGPFTAINCAAIPTHLLESELFGFRKGAFTGADRDKPGILQAAEGGTVLLDEVGDMPLEAQAKLLRVIETREVTSLGSIRPEPANIRFVCATNKDLAEEARQSRFRSDLLARIGALTLTLPPLRQRKEDLYRLVRHFLGVRGGAELEASFAFMLCVCDYDWPHNVRELAAAVARAVAVADEPVLAPRHLPPALQERMTTYGHRQARGEPERPRTSAPPPSASTPAGAGRAIPGADELRALLTRHEGNVTSVARELGKDRAQVHRLIVRYGLVPDDYRPRRG
jgi:DNA-binding NtrC family response regulator